VTWTDWIPEISTSSVLTVIGVIVGTYYKAKVERAIQHNFDEKPEALKAQLRRDEEQLKADLRARDDEIAALRSGALSGMASVQVAGIYGMYATLSSRTDRMDRRLERIERRLDLVEV
jgi:hypothetical protein